MSAKAPSATPSPMTPMSRPAKRKKKAPSLPLASIHTPGVNPFDETLNWGPTVRFIDFHGIKFRIDEWPAYDKL